LLTENFVIGASQRAGKPPRWISLGLGAQLASRVEPRGGYALKLRRDAYDLWEINWVAKGNEALGGEGKADEVRAVGFAVLEWMNSEARAVVPAFIQGMLAGQEKLDDVIAKVLNGTREEFLAGSQQFVGMNYGTAQ
jgi:hypothetical protein